MFKVKGPGPALALWVRFELIWGFPKIRGTILGGSQ